MRAKQGQTTSIFLRSSSSSISLDALGKKGSCASIAFAPLFVTCMPDCFCFFSCWQMVLCKSERACMCVCLRLWGSICLTQAQAASRSTRMRYWLRSLFLERTINSTIISGCTARTRCLPIHPPPPARALSPAAACHRLPEAGWGTLRRHAATSQAPHRSLTRDCRFFSSFSRRASSFFCSLRMFLTVRPSSRESYVRSTNSCVSLSPERISCINGGGAGRCDEGGREGVLFFGDFQ